MEQPRSGDDPIMHALDGLVRSGAIPPERARAAYEASLRPPASVRAREPEPVEESRQFRLETIAIAIGVGLLAATIGVAAGYARQSADLDGSNYALGIVASLALLGVAAGALLVVKDDVRKRNLAAWPGAVGALGAGTMIVVGLDDNPATGYVAGLATAALSAAGYYLVRRGAYVIAAIIGLLMTYLTLVDDIVDVGGTEGDNVALTIAAAVMVFAIAITAAGWLLPTRDVGGVFVGALTIAAYVVVLIGISVVVAMQRAFAGFGPSLSGVRTGPDPGRFDNDVYLMLLFTAILVAGWALCALLSGHVGYRLLILVMVSSVVPLATVALALEHPSWWSLGVGVVGSLVLGVVGLRALGVIGDYRRRPPLRPSGGGPIDLDEPH